MKLPTKFSIDTVYRIEASKDDWIELWVTFSKGQFHLHYEDDLEEKMVLSKFKTSNKALTKLKEGINHCLNGTPTYKYKGSKRLLPKAPKLKLKMPTLPLSLDPDAIYRLENTKTRNAFWEIWSENRGDEFSDIFIHYGKIGTKGITKALYLEVINENVTDLIWDSIKSKIAKNYVYLGAYKSTETWDTKGSSSKKQKGAVKAQIKAKEPEAINVLEVTKNMYKRVIKIVD